MPNLEPVAIHGLKVVPDCRVKFLTSADRGSAEASVFSDRAGTIPVDQATFTADSNGLYTVYHAGGDVWIHYDFDNATPPAPFLLSVTAPRISATITYPLGKNVAAGTTVFNHAELYANKYVVWVDGHRMVRDLTGLEDDGFNDSVDGTVTLNFGVQGGVDVWAEVFTETTALVPLNANIIAGLQGAPVALSADNPALGREYFGARLVTRAVDARGGGTFSLDFALAHIFLVQVDNTGTDSVTLDVINLPPSKYTAMRAELAVTTAPPTTFGITIAGAGAPEDGNPDITSLTDAGFGVLVFESFEGTRVYAGLVTETAV